MNLTLDLSIYPSSHRGNKHWNSNRTINLLPWREQKREQDKKYLTSLMILCAVLAVMIVFLLHYYASGLVKNQKFRNKMLQKEISVMDNRIKEINELQQTKERLLSKISLEQRLQTKRILIVHLLDELLKIIPSEIYLTQIEEKKEAEMGADKDAISDPIFIILRGYAESNTYISLLMKNIGNNGWLHHPVLNEIKKEGGIKQVSANEFKLTLLLGLEQSDVE